jgi:hypothetical protein
MHAWPDAPVVAQFLTRARRRVTTLMAIRHAAAGLACGALAAVVARALGASPPMTAAAIAALSFVIAVAIAIVRAPRSAAAAAAAVEARAAGCRNILITAAELLAAPGEIRPAIGTRVMHDAARTAAGIEIRSIFPAGRTALAAGAAGAIAAVAGFAIVARPGSIDAVARAIGRGPQPIDAIDVRVIAPDYARLPPAELSNPAHVEALAGSSIEVMVRGAAETVSVDTASGAIAVNRDGDGLFTAVVVLDRDGFLGIRATSGDATASRLIPLRATTDARPMVRISTPGKDLVVPDGNRSLSLDVTAEDDLALESLRLVYTRVTGAGENFTFADGDVPLTIARTADRTWTASATWPLAPLALEPGDMVVYRALARDRKPGAPAGESDAFIVEVASPGMVAVEGFAIDDREDRYAISQQMVILKTERLIARRGSLAAEALADESHTIAAEQRQVRAEFVFMMGGHIEDEEVEAAGEHEVAEGRLENRGRIDIVRAINAMSTAATALTDVDLDAALAAERRALEALQRAFTRSRYILRTLSARERVDETRRLSGALAGAASTVRPAAIVPAADRVRELRDLLAGLVQEAGRLGAGTADAAAIDRLASNALRIDPAAETMQQAAAALIDAAAALRRADPAAVAARMNDASTRVTAALRDELARAAPAPPSATRRAIDSALAAARSGGGR